VSKRATIVLALAALATAAGSTALGSGKAGSETVARIDYVADGDTVDLTNGQRVRLVQIDTPEVYFGMECYGLQASATTKRLLPPGALVRLLVEPKTTPYRPTAAVDTGPPVRPRYSVSRMAPAIRLWDEPNRGGSR
jgi:endonuclease YncB( thermonuclease family)